MSDLIDILLPRHRVHVLGGVSDAGKTRFIIPAMLDFASGKPLFAHTSHPVPWAYVSGDRSLQEAHDTISSMDINPATISIIPAFGKENKKFNQIIEAASLLRPCPQLLIIEGFQDLPVGDFRRDVRTFLSNANAYCQPSKEFPLGLTLIGILESPKMKPNEKYSNPRQRISGVSSWGFHTSTVMLLEAAKDDPSYETEYRDIWFCVKNGKRVKYSLIFNEKGQLVPLP